MNSKESQKRIINYNKVYEDCVNILKGEKHLDVFSFKASPEPSSESLEKFNEYLKGFLKENDRGMLRTLLIIGKPFKRNQIVKDTLEMLANKLREGSSSGKI